MVKGRQSRSQLLAWRVLTRRKQVQLDMRGGDHGRDEGGSRPRSCRWHAQPAHGQGEACLAKRLVRQGVADNRTKCPCPRGIIRSDGRSNRRRRTRRKGKRERRDAQAGAKQCQLNLGLAQVIQELQRAHDLCDTRANELACVSCGPNMTPQDPDTSRCAQNGDTRRVVGAGSGLPRQPPHLRLAQVEVKASVTTLLCIMAKARATSS